MFIALLFEKANIGDTLGVQTWEDISESGICTSWNTIQSGVITGHTLT